MIIYKSHESRYLISDYIIASTLAYTNPIISFLYSSNDERFQCDYMMKHEAMIIN
ncbi:hypothetical protein Lalb_Chr09g0324301 [Lupinus albus]|uniref:Uncharacterized protein n=1 Tax=Lupinus albus TaxID=3870 RepID=A0A6A4Q052_LUPAL|nr:hypothetical protein Lalb_Chr09g0324301 [Lupinus albus]